tara:strand:+ start:217 stop:432 length:216 start_codon:yes stop_codon:yes gene_type:complete
VDDPNDPFLNPPPAPELECPKCRKVTDYLIEFYDRFGCYSGRACSEKCGEELPGQGAMRGYDPEEPIEEDY